MAGGTVEIESIRKSLCHLGANYQKQKQPLYVGSAKFNVGHLESVSRPDGLIKAILILGNVLITPVPKFCEAKIDLNPHS